MLYVHVCNHVGLCVQSACMYVCAVATLQLCVYVCICVHMCMYVVRVHVHACVNPCMYVYVAVRPQGLNEGLLINIDVLQCMDS